MDEFVLEQPLRYGHTRGSNIVQRGEPLCARTRLYCQAKSPNIVQPGELFLFCASSAAYRAI